MLRLEDTRKVLGKVRPVLAVVVSDDKLMLELQKLALQAYWNGYVFWTYYNLHQFRQWTKNL